MAEYEEGVPDEEAREYDCRDGAAMFQYWTHLARAANAVRGQQFPLSVRVIRNFGPAKLQYLKFRACILGRGRDFG